MKLASCALTRWARLPCHRVQFYEQIRKCRRVGCSVRNSREELAPIFSNRSASFLKLSKVGQALADADKCVELKPGWDKAHFRRAAALEAGDNDEDALAALEVGQKVFGGGIQGVFWCV